MMRRILVIDDEEAIRHSLASVLRDEKYEVALAESGEEGLKMVEEEDPDLVLLDIWLPGIDGLETLKILKERFPLLPVLIMSGHGSIETAVKATKLGAYDFIEKPLNLDKVFIDIEHALRSSRLAEENIFLRDRVKRGHEMVGKSTAFKELQEQIRIVAPTKASVLITGENGTGKELVAQYIHGMSERAEGPFVEVNCAAIPENLIESELFGHEKGSFTGATNRRRGKFDLADRGTLFLDEIGDMSLTTQAKILRVLQEMRYERVGGSRTYEVDVRVIAATNKDLEVEIGEGRFREDLYFRLNVIPVTLAPLRERREDIPILAEYFINFASAEYGRESAGITEGALKLLADYKWPGNVRELKNIVERMVIMSGGAKIDVGHIPPTISGNSSKVGRVKVDSAGLSMKDARRNFERSYLLSHLEANEWNVSKTAQEVELDRSSLYKKMKELEIEPPAEED
ncbi:MAG: Fis family transcriptional regulator [Deltaproteobacteria bacterium]|nr:MAG: Fis family transcriptional regulator [Deltaproteobacteria bacterium]